MLDLRDPERLEAELRAVKAQIREAFRGVSRAGGVSWSESRVIDDFGTEVECAAARASDRDKSWEELVDDRGWEDCRGIGGFSFLDPIGFAYYIAPAMIRCVQRGEDGCLAFHLIVNGKFSRRFVDNIGPEQSRTIARFLRLMMVLEEPGIRDVADSEPDIALLSTSEWGEAYRSHWKHWDAPAGGT